MPAGLVEDEHGVHVRCELAREVLEENLHRARIGSRSGQRKRLVVARPARGEQVQAPVELIDHAGRALATLIPEPCGASFLPDARLVLTPDLKALAGMLIGQRPQPGGELLF